jgi:hypothetical protein
MHAPHVIREDLKEWNHQDILILEVIPFLIPATIEFY